MNIPRCYSRTVWVTIVAWMSALQMVGCGWGNCPSGDTRWNDASRSFHWVGGEITIPENFKYERRQGLDTHIGTFTSPDGKLEIKYEIGELAGALSTKDGRTDHFEERIAGGVKVWLAQKSDPSGPGNPSTIYVMTIPNADCANFYLRSSLPKDAKWIEAIAASYRPSEAAKKGCGSCRY